MKILNFNFVLPCLLLIGVLFITSCAKEAPIQIPEVVEVAETSNESLIENQMEEARRIATENEFENCFTGYFIPFDDKLTNMEEANAYFLNLSEEDREMFSKTIDLNDLRGTCGPKERLGCGFEPDCFFSSCTYLPYRIEWIQDCTHGMFTGSFCWMTC